MHFYIFYGILCLIDILKFTLKCDIQTTLVGTGLVGTIFKTKSHSIYEKFLCKARGLLRFSSDFIFFKDQNWQFFDSKISKKTRNWRLLVKSKDFLTL